MPKCFKKGNAANCSLTERLAASRKYGIVRREKYSARPAALTTTFTTLGLSYSAGSWIAVAAVDISVALQRPRHRVDHRRIDQRFVPLDIHHRVARAPARHLRDPVRPARVRLAAVISTRQNRPATSAIRASSVATMTSDNSRAARHRSPPAR